MNVVELERVRPGPRVAPVETDPGFERLISDTSARLIAAPFDDLDPAIEVSLDSIRTFFRAERCGLLNVHETLQVVNVAFAAYAEGVSRVSDGVDLAGSFPWCRQRLLVNREPVVVSRMAELPPEAAVDRASWERLGTKSSLTIPILVGPVVRQLIAIDTVFEERDWSHGYLPRVRLLGEMLLNAIERKRTFDALRLSESRLDRAAAAGGSGCWEFDAGAGQLWWTDVTRRLYGFGPGEAITYDRFINRIHPDDRTGVLADLAAATQPNGRFDGQYRIVLDDGSLRWMHASGRADAEQRLLGVSVDVTERVEADRVAREQRARLAAAVDVAELGFLVWSTGSDAPFFDPRMRDLLGTTPATTAELFQCWFSRLDAHDRAVLLEQRRRLLAREISRIAIEYRYQHPDRGETWLRHTTRRHDAGSAGGEYFVTALLDVTEQRKREQQLRAALDEVSQLRQQVQRENVYLRQESRDRLGVDLVIGRSPAIRRALGLVREVASTNSTVFLIGETGTGKERFASLIHELSSRHRRAMVRVNCPGIPGALIESELFGREKGAYTGALSRQIGRFEVANGSTLFLDEIGDLALETQVKLLRVIQERTIERLGSPRPIPVDVRIIAATNRDLDRAVREGTFRSDLYYRINVFPIVIPPLRERLDDIPLLVQAFIDEIGPGMGKRPEAVERSSLEARQRYSWPGNIRELRNVVERAMIRASGPVLRIDLPTSSSAPAPPGNEDGQPSDGRPVSDLHQVEREHILRVLRDTGWRILGARVLPPKCWASSRPRSKPEWRSSVSAVRDRAGNRETPTCRTGRIRWRPGAPPRAPSTRRRRTTYREPWVISGWQRLCCKPVRYLPMPKHMTSATLTIVSLLLSPAGPGGGWQPLHGAAVQTAPQGKPAARAQPSDPYDIGWPRAYSTASGARLVFYQPQIADWPDQKHMTAYAAVSYLARNAQKPAIGTIRIETDASVAVAERLVSFRDFRITEANFPTLIKEQLRDVLSEFAASVPHEDRVIGLDRVLAMVNTSQVKPRNIEGVKADPPTVFYSEKPAILAIFDGEPIWSPIEGNDLRFAVNTNWDVFEHSPSRNYYLRLNDGWLASPAIRGPWSRTGRLPDSFGRLPDDGNWTEVKAAAKNPSKAAPPAVFVSTVPAELVLLSGAPQYAAVADTSLLWVSNTESDVFRLRKDGPVFYLVSGRWFSAPQFKGPWTFATPALPDDFKKIPLEHPRSRVLASVPGTRQAIEAVVIAQVPQTATVNRRTIEAPAVVYQGEPTFQPIEKTTIARAVNTDRDILKVGDLYYLCFEGVWFRSTSPTGPWQATDSVPGQIYEIPISSPAHNVTYVTVEDSDDDSITFVAAAAYTGMMVAWGCAVWGNGWYYPPYYYPGYYPVYFPHYPTYGYGAWFNPWTGAYGRGGAIYGPYGGAGYVARYNPATGRYSRGAVAYGPYGARGAAEAWNPRTGAYGRTRQGANVYGSWGATAVQRGDQWASTARVTSRATGTTTRVTEGSGGGAAITRRGPEGGGGIARTGSGDIYAGHDGNAYRNQDGGWQKYDNGTWTNVERPQRPEGTAGTVGAEARKRAGQTGLSSPTMDQLNRDRAARVDGSQRMRDLGSMRGTARPTAGSYRPRAGGGRRR